MSGSSWHQTFFFSQPFLSLCICGFFFYILNIGITLTGVEVIFQKYSLLSVDCNGVNVCVQERHQ